MTLIFSRTFTLLLDKTFFADPHTIQDRVLWKHIMTIFFSFSTIVVFKNASRLAKSKSLKHFGSLDFQTLLVNSLLQNLLKVVYPIMFTSNVFHNSHLIQKCKQNQQLLLICIHFWTKWELWKTFNSKMIEWTHFTAITLKK